jgi:hypothetical protein
VVVCVIVAGIRRYELQNDVAGAPSCLRTAKAPVTTWQLTARSLRLTGAGFDATAAARDRMRTRLHWYIMLHSK